MAVRSFSGRDGELRLYDNNAHYISLKFVGMNFSAPMGRPRAIENTVVTAGGFFHAPTGPDFESTTYEPVPISFSLWVNTDDWNVHRSAFSNIDMDEPWVVGAHTWTTTAGKGSLIRPDGSYLPTELFFDVKKKTVDVQLLWRGPATSGSVVGMKYEETYFAPQNLSIQESSDFVEIRASGLAYGNVQPIGAFTPGTSSI